MSSRDQDFIGCRFCTWRTRKFQTGSEGMVRTGWSRLSNHIAHAHPDEREKLTAALDASDRSEAAL